MKFKIMSAVFALCLAAALAAVVLGGGDVSGENRAQSELPALTLENIKSGEFAEGVESYLDDRIAYRAEMIDLSQKISAYKGTDAPEGKVILADVDQGTGVKQSSNLLLLDGSIMEMFEKNHAAADKYAAALNTLAENLGDGITLYSMLVPTRLEFQEELYSNLQDSQRDEIDYIYSQTADGVNAVNVYDTLKDHSGEYIYFRTDHHWTMLGAYYAYKSFCAETGADGAEINEYEKHTIEGFVGQLSAFSDEELTPDTIEWYDVNTRGNMDWSMTAYPDDGESYNYRSVLYDESRNDYDFFLGSDHAFARFTNSELPDGKTIIIICDSYANDFAPWLMTGYKNVILTDPRTYGGSLKDMISEYSPDEVLVLNYIFTASFEDYCDMLASLCAGAA